MTSSDEEAPATNVVEAWRRVMRDMPNVGKDNRMEQGQKYNYRSIEQFTGHAAGLMARHGVIVMPLGEEITYHDVGKTQSGALILEARGTWAWRIYGPGGREDYLDARSFGEGRDTSDKAAQKAATSAFKYLLMPSLMISDSKDDPDHDRIEGAGPAPAPQPLSDEDQAHEDHAKAVIQQARDLKKLDNEGTGPYWKGIVDEAGESENAKAGSALAISRWVRSDVDYAEELLTRMAKSLKADRNQPPAEVHHEPPPPAPEKPKRTRAKPGSAVEEATNVVKGAFPGAEEVAE